MILIAQLCCGINAVQLIKAEKTFYKKSYKAVRKERKELVAEINCFSNIISFPDYAAYTLFVRDYAEELLEKERKEKQLYICYQRAKKYLKAKKSILTRFWLNRIRYASRAIGNMWDYSLLMLATPPTTYTVDELIRQRGGAGVVCLN